MAGEGEVRLEAKAINFEDLVRRLEQVEKLLGVLQQRGQEVDVDVDTSRLAQAEAALKQVRAELEALKKKAKEAGVELGDLDDEGGQVSGTLSTLKAGLAVAATAMAAFIASIGVSKLIEFGSVILDTAKGLAQLDARLSAAGIGGEQLEKLGDRANQLGLNFESLQDNFGRFLAAWVRAGGDLDEGTAIFEAWTVALSGAGASAEEVDRIITQLTQGINRGKFEQEDWNSVSEAGIGVQALLKKAYGENTEALAKLKARGLVPARLELLALAPELVNTFGPQAQQNAEGLLGIVARYENALFDVRRELAEKLTPQFAAWIDLVTTGLTGGSSAADAFGDILVAAMQKGRDAAIGTIATIQAVGQAFRDMFKPRSEVPDFFERIEGNITQILGRIRAKEEEANRERAAADAAAAEQADALRKKSLELQTQVLAQGTAETKKAAADRTAVWQQFAAATAPLAAGVTDTGGGEAPAAVAGIQQITDELETLRQKAFELGQQSLLGQNVQTELDATWNRIRDLEAAASGIGPAFQAAGPAVSSFGSTTSQATEQGRQAIQALLTAIRGPGAQAFEALGAAGSRNVQLIVNRFAQLVESNRATAADAQQFGADIEAAFATAGQSIGGAATSAADLAAQIGEVVTQQQASTEATLDWEQGLREAGEGTIEYKDGLIILGEEGLKPAEENTITLADGTELLVEAQKDAEESTITLKDGTELLIKSQKDAAEGAGELAAEIPKAGDEAKSAAPEIEKAGTAAGEAADKLEAGGAGAQELAAGATSAADASEQLADQVTAAAEAVDPDLTEAIRANAAALRQLMENVAELVGTTAQLRANLEGIVQTQAGLEGVGGAVSNIASSAASAAQDSGTLLANLGSLEIA